jgi:hypothetical protein
LLSLKLFTLQELEPPPCPALILTQELGTLNNLLIELNGSKGLLSRATKEQEQLLQDTEGELTICEPQGQHMCGPALRFFGRSTLTDGLAPPAPCRCCRDRVGTFHPRGARCDQHRRPTVYIEGFSWDPSLDAPGCTLECSGTATHLAIRLSESLNVVLVAYEDALSKYLSVNDQIQKIYHSCVRVE